MRDMASQLQVKSMNTHLGQQNDILPIHFHKIIMDTNVERLKIPNAFTRRYGGGLSNPMFVKPPDGTEWEVHWRKQNGEVWFEKGWKEFTENYSLDHGYFLVFKYEGTSQFDVLIFNHSALETDYPYIDNLCQNDDESVKILEEITSVQKGRTNSPLFSHPLRKRTRKGTHGNVIKSSNLQKLHVGDHSDKGMKLLKTNKDQHKEGLKTTIRTSSLNWPKAVRAREIAKKFVTENCFFTFLIKPVHLAGYALSCVPKFTHGESKEQNVILQLGKRSWSVKFVCYSNARFGNFSSRWSLFATESKLQVGDVCIFELIDKEVPLLKVHVTKSNR